MNGALSDVSKMDKIFLTAPKVLISKLLSRLQNSRLLVAVESGLFNQSFLSLVLAWLHWPEQTQLQCSANNHKYTNIGNILHREQQRFFETFSHPANLHDEVESVPQ